MLRYRLAAPAAMFVLTAWAGVCVVADEPADKPKVALQILDWKQTQELVGRHRGQVVVLDAWSTSCEPCVKEFPHLVKLHRKYGGKSVVCISMSCDYAGIKSKPPESYRARVLGFLEKQGATFDNVLSNVPSDDLFEQMDLPAIPAVYVYGRDGKLVKRFDNSDIKSEDDAFTYEDVTRLVEELVAK